jgi:hypothetical protein
MRKGSDSRWIYDEFKPRDWKDVARDLEIICRESLKKGHPVKGEIKSRPERVIPEWK